MSMYDDLTGPGADEGESRDCPFWRDGKHHWYSNGPCADYRFQNYPAIWQHCACGATRKVYDD